MENLLYFGDNLKILREYVSDASVDLIYLDPACARLPSGRAGRPPFNSSPSAFARGGERKSNRAAYNFSVAPLDACPDAGRERRKNPTPPVADRRYSGWSQEAEAVYRKIVESGPRKLADLMQAPLAFLGRNDMMAYLPATQPY